jgi:hypothetical protein
MPVIESVEGADVKIPIEPDWEDWYRARVWLMHWAKGLNQDA